MKISRLYIKNFILVMAIIIAAQVCIALMFRLVAPRGGSQNFQQQVNAMAFMVREHMKTMPPEKESRYYTPFLQELAYIWFCDVWLEDDLGNTVASSTWLARPRFPEKMLEIEKYGLFIEKPEPPLQHLIIKSEDGRRIFYIRKKLSGPFFRDFHFILGIGIITLIVALILLPVSKRMASPLKRLTESANAISRGEFNIRVEDASHDEVGELARAFNVMSGRVLQMIDGTKELTANISHQIRSPLGRIAVSVDLLRERIASGKKKEAGKMLDSIEQEISDMVRLTERIIELIHVETAHSSIEYTDVALTDVVSETAAKYHDLMARKSLAFSAEYSKIPIIIQAVRRDISELFDILFDNVARYSTPGGSVVCDVAEDEACIGISLSNDMAGVTDEMLDSVFKPFQRYAPEKIPGNGLGLAIASKIVENHGGMIKADYSDGRFVIRIEFNKAAN